VLKAKDDPDKVRLICGRDCRAYQMLKDTIDGTATYRGLSGLGHFASAASVSATIQAW